MGNLKFFYDIPKQIENKIVGTHKNYQDYLINPIEKTFNLDLITQQAQRKCSLTEKLLKANKTLVPPAYQTNYLKSSKSL